MSTSIKKYSEAILDATDLMLASDPQVVLFGLGITAGAGGTANGLHIKYPSQIFETPTSEAAATGLVVGAAISGMKPIIHHDRVEFSLLATDQMFTQAAKWNYMFGGDNNVPAVFRIIVGRQWGNGPQHSQSFYSMFGNVRGIKVVIPSTPYMAKGLTIAAIKDKNPVVILEPRWVYGIKQNIPNDSYEVALDKANVIKQGTHATVVAYGDGLISVLQAQELLKDIIDLEIIDLVSLNPIDEDTIFESVRKTKKLICIDTTNESFNVGSEIISRVARKCGNLDSAPLSISCPDVPCPTSTELSEDYYPTRVSIANDILKYFGNAPLDIKLSFEEIHLAPGHTI